MISTALQVDPVDATADEDDLVRIGSPSLPMDLCLLR